MGIVAPQGSAHGLARICLPRQTGHATAGMPNIPPGLFEAELKVDLLANLAHRKAEQLSSKDSFVASLARRYWFRRVPGRALAELYSTTQPAAARAAASEWARDLLPGWATSSWWKTPSLP